jgi:hypothetical protein
MRSTNRFTTALVAVLLVAGPAAAQERPQPETQPAEAVETPAKTDTEKEKSADLPQILKERPITMQYFRPNDKRGINMFETPKIAGVEYTGFKLDWGAGFTSQVQNLRHENTALPNVVAGVNQNQLADIGFGFNNSTANLHLNAQLAKGIRVALTSYLSARHHNETWVKDGYVQIDESPIDIKPLNALMKYVTLRVGHMEINYGDAHFRRTDNGNAIYNPFVGNYIMDAFTTEIGGEAYLKVKGVVAMAAITGGEIRGTVLNPGQRGPTFIGKLGVDRQVKPNLRLRLTGSLYRADKSASNTLYGGDRAGSRYYYVLENTAATEAAQFTSGAINPGFRNQVQAMQINPFVKFGGLEVFGVIERAEGKAATEAAERTFNQQAVDVVYRALPGEPVFIGARFNRVNGRLAGMASDVEGKRVQLSAGWFLTSSILVKAEIVDEKFSGYPTTHIRNGGRFKGTMLEGVIVF